MPEQEYLFHYTDSNACVEILRRGEIWATQLGQMNDSSEGRIVRNIASKLLEKMAKESRNSETKIALLELSILVGDAPFVQRCYIFSLSENGDSLSQWRAYTPEGGYSIGLDRHRLTELCEKNSWQLKRCEYDNGNQEQEIRNRIVTVLDDHGSVADAILENVASAIDEKIRDLETHYKHQSFSEEREWRVVITPDKQSEENHGDWRARGAAIVGYQKIDLSTALKNKLLQVYFSPGLYTTDRKNTLFWMLLNNGYANPIIKKSESPYMS